MLNLRGGQKIGTSRKEKNTMGPDELLQKIERSFGDTKMPLGEPFLRGGYDDLESQQLASAYAGKTWQEISLDIVKEYRAWIMSLTPTWFAFFMPTWLTLTVKYAFKVDTLIDNLVFLLAPLALLPDYFPIEEDNLKHDSWLEELAKHLTHEQHCVILDFLYWLAEIVDDVILVAAVDFWSRQCG